MDGSHPQAPRAHAITASHAASFSREVAPMLPGMRACALRLTRSPADADDLVQDALVRAYRFWSSYSAGTQLSAWLNRIVKNTFFNDHRRAQREREAIRRLRALMRARDDEHRCKPSLDAQNDAGFSDDVEAALSRIAPEFRAVLLEVAVNELSYGEAAERLGCPIGTVMSRLHRARRALGPELGEQARALGI